MPIERRRAPRKTLTDLAFINLEPDNGGIVVDVSEEGLGFHSAVPVELSAPVKFWFSMRSIDRLDASGVVAWTDESRKTGGIKFVELNDDVRERIRSWLGEINITGGSSPAIESNGGVAVANRGTPAVTPTSLTHQASTRGVPGTSVLFGSMRRDPPGEPSKEPQTATPPESASVAESAVATANPVAQAPQTSDQSYSDPRPSLLTSPLSLLATEPLSGRNALTDALFSEQHMDSAQISPTDSHTRSGLPMIVVVFAAIAVTVAGYYTLRLRTPRPLAPQQTQLPIPQDPAPSIAPPANSTDASSTSPTAALPPSTSASDQSSISAPPIKSASTQTPADSAASSAPAPAIDDAGKAELDEARLLLRGVNGRRDPARAAQLLWSAVGNGSVIAEVELARLYIAGDGVRKNCEQARVLLRAAISRGSDDATGQLAELARSGCSK